MIFSVTSLNASLNHIIESNTHINLIISLELVQAMEEEITDPNNFFR